jgi:hypothetical protein
MDTHRPSDLFSLDSLTEILYEYLISSCVLCNRGGLARCSLFNALIVLGKKNKF